MSNIERSKLRAYKRYGLYSEPQTLEECYDKGYYYRRGYVRGPYKREYKYFAYYTNYPEKEISATCVKFPKPNDLRRVTLRQLKERNKGMQIPEMMHLISMILRYRRGGYISEDDKIPLRPGVVVNYKGVTLKGQEITDEEFAAVTRQANRNELYELGSPKKRRQTTSPQRSPQRSPRSTTSSLLSPPLPPPPSSLQKSAPGPSRARTSLPQLPPLSSSQSVRRSPLTQESQVVEGSPRRSSVVL
jgi:hypothetical protein